MVRRERKIEQLAHDITQLAKLMLLTAVLAACGPESKYPSGRSEPGSVMLILRGIASGESPRGLQGAAEVVVKEDPPEGHMAGPKSLLCDGRRECGTGN